MDSKTIQKVYNTENEISSIRNGEDTGTLETVNLLRSTEKFIATASSTLDSYTIDKIYDGNKTDNASRWVSSSSDTTPTVTVKFENSVTVSNVYIKNGYNSEFAARVKIYADNNLVGDFTYGVAEKTFNLNKVSCEEIKFVFDKGVYNYVRIFEIEIYGEKRNNIVWPYLITWEKWSIKEHREWDNKKLENRIFYTVEKFIELVSAREGIYPDDGIKGNFYYKKKG